MTARTSVVHILHHHQTTLRGVHPLPQKHQKRALKKGKQLKVHGTKGILDGFSPSLLCSPARSLYMCRSVSKCKALFIPNVRIHKRNRPPTVSPVVMLVLLRKKYAPRSETQSTKPTPVCSEPKKHRPRV